MNHISPADYEQMSWPARVRLKARLANNAKLHAGHGGNATPAQIRATAEAEFALLPTDPKAAEHRLTLHHALTPDKTKAA